MTRHEEPRAPEPAVRETSPSPQGVLFGVDEDPLAEKARKLEAKARVLRAVSRHGWFWPTED